MTSLPNGSVLGKPPDAAAQREILTNNIRTAVAKAKLATTTLEQISIQLRHRQLTNEQAMTWIKAEGLDHFLQFGPKVRP